jgi:hypothetical protein
MTREVALEVVALLRELGYGSAKALKAALAALLDAGLTRSGKSRISSEKRDRVEAELAARFRLVCGDQACRDEMDARVREERGADRAARILSTADARFCRVCGGSDNARAVGRMARLLRARGLSRLLVVGGSPASRMELERLVGGALEIRTVCGTDRRTLEEAQRDRAWADVLVVWGGTQLDHVVSELYVGRAARARVITVRRRGIAALADGIASSLAR